MKPSLGGGGMTFWVTNESRLYTIYTPFLQRLILWLTDLTFNFP